MQATTAEGTNTKSQTEAGNKNPLGMEDVHVGQSNFGTSSASRSVLSTVDNQTSRDLSRKDVHLDHGTWTENEYPEEIIPQKSKEEHQAESDGFMTGTKGSVTYEIDEELTVTFNFNNPYMGGNSFSATIAGTDASNYKVTADGTSADNATVTYTLKHV
ncbi:putative crystal protein ET79 [Rosellinia necatrix]|uniref:Putative crystal protein ET79 n=1 Tax=Rosellinia necatrix TaxID=77044 RepID=A0A1W2TQZ6_ROSNE|nr:putative crystal protein ET79 [Rosellinia necatrix]